MNCRLVLFLVGACSAIQTTISCDTNCQDYHRHCDDLNSNSDVDEEGLPLFNGVDQTCDSEYVKSRCPKTCNVCEACEYATADSVADLNDQQSQIDDLQSQIDQISSESSFKKGAFDQGEVPEDSDGYRLFFRSSSSEVNFDEVNAFYTFGTSLGANFPNKADSSQFRDNNFFWYHGDNKQMRYSIYDQYGDLFANVDFDFGDAHPTILTALDDTYVTGSSYWTDLVANSGQGDDWTTMIHSYGRFFAMIKSYGGCQNDKLWFLGSSVDATACNWDTRWTKGLRGSSLDKVVYLYCPHEICGYANGRLNFASHFEISYKGGDFSSATNGFERVWRYSAGSGIHALSHYEDGGTDSSADFATAFAATVYTDDLFRASDMQSQLEGASQVLLVIYSREGIVAEAMTFKANGDFKTWMSSDNLLASLVWQIDSSNFFGVDGDPTWGRRFYINRSYGGCDADAGWLVIPCMRDSDGYVPCTNWDGMYAEGNTAADDQICPIMYSSQSGSTTWSDANGPTEYASAIEIYVR